MTGFIVLVLIVLLVLNMSVMYKVQLLCDRIDDNLVDIEMQSMKVEQRLRRLE